MVITDQDEPHAVINIRRTRVIEGRHRTPGKDVMEMFVGDSGCDTTRILRYHERNYPLQALLRREVLFLLRHLDQLSSL